MVRNSGRQISRIMTIPYCMRSSMSNSDKKQLREDSHPMRRATDRKPQKYMLAIKDVAKLLHQRSRINDEQYEMILQRGEAQAARLNSHLKPSQAKKDIYLAELASPAQVITSFSLEIPTTQKKLSEDVITELIAHAAGMEYLKID